MATIKEAQSRIKARVWQALAQTTEDTKELDREAVEAVVDLVTEAALMEMDVIITENLAASQSASAAETKEADYDDEEEDILWEGRPFLSPILYYTITDERIKIKRGILGREFQYLELIRIQDMDHSQTFGERLLKIGDVHIRSHDPSHPDLILKNVRDPQAVYEVLRKAVMKARKRHNFSYREEM